MEKRPGLVVVLFKHSHAPWPASSTADPPLFFPLGRERVFAHPPTLLESISKIRQRRLVPICKGSRSQTNRVQRVLEFARVAPSFSVEKGKSKVAMPSRQRPGLGLLASLKTPIHTSSMFHNPAPLMVGERSKRCVSRAVLALRKVDSCRHGLRSGFANHQTKALPSQKHDDRFGAFVVLTTGSRTTCATLPRSYLSVADHRPSTIDLPSKYLISSSSTVRDTLETHCQNP